MPIQLFHFNSHIAFRRNLWNTFGSDEYERFCPIPIISLQEAVGNREVNQISQTDSCLPGPRPQISYFGQKVAQFSQKVAQFYQKVDQFSQRVAQNRAQPSFYLIFELLATCIGSHCFKNLPRPSDQLWFSPKITMEKIFISWLQNCPKQLVSKCNSDSFCMVEFFFFANRRFLPIKFSPKWRNGTFLSTITFKYRGET